MSAGQAQSTEEWKCEKCGKVLLEHQMRAGVIIKICPKCKHKNVLYR